MFNSNKPIKVAHLQKSANQSLLNGALVMEIGNNSFIESKKNLFDEAENVLIEKKKTKRYENMLLLDFAKYLSYSKHSTGTTF